MLMQVFRLTPDQVNNLPPSDREAVQPESLVCIHVNFTRFHLKHSSPSKNQCMDLVNPNT